MAGQEVIEQTGKDKHIVGTLGNVHIHVHLELCISKSSVSGYIGGIISHVSLVGIIFSVEVIIIRDMYLLSASRILGVQWHGRIPKVIHPSHFPFLPKGYVIHPHPLPPP